MIHQVPQLVVHQTVEGVLDCHLHMHSKCRKMRTRDYFALTCNTPLPHFTPRWSFLLGHQRFVHQPNHEMCRPYCFWTDYFSRLIFIFLSCSTHSDDSKQKHPNKYSRQNPAHPHTPNIRNACREVHSSCQMLQDDTRVIATFPPNCIFIGID